jgi:hypothetical protein
MESKDINSHKIYIQALRNLTPEQRLMKAFEMHEFGIELFKHGLRKRFPDLSEEEFHKLFLERLEKCRNRNW